MFLSYIFGCSEVDGFLRASGGVSDKSRAYLRWLEFSPRKRRCFLKTLTPILKKLVFSAQAEVFPPAAKSSPSSARFLRASGGVSFICDFILGKKQFSPRKRRCFCLSVPFYPGYEFSPRKRRCFCIVRSVEECKKVFSAQAEVFPPAASSPETRPSFLRASGGVSIRRCGFYRLARFSPRKRRCFFYKVRKFDSPKVFSAQAEVFPAYQFHFTPATSFLRASGGVSDLRGPFLRRQGFSPRKRRCFQVLFWSRPSGRVFSAQAEVFLGDFSWSILEFRFLRASGGVSAKRALQKATK